MVRKKQPKDLGSERAHLLVLFLCTPCVDEWNSYHFLNVQSLLVLLFSIKNSVVVPDVTSVLEVATLIGSIIGDLAGSQG